jgi:hypothetical protein
MSLCEECKMVAAVGWGNPPEWLCQEHFEERLAQALGPLLTRPIHFLDPVFAANEAKRGR